jgi:hypothetical protein
MKNKLKQKGRFKDLSPSCPFRTKTINAWPAHIQKIAGAWKDLPLVDEIQKGLGPDFPREPIS